MSIPRPFHLLCLLFGLSVATAAGGPVLVEDRFEGPEHPGRRAMRGEWRFEENTAHCTQDDELYRKYKDHGPILFYDLAGEDLEVSVRFKAEGARTVVFTANGEAGHVFRLVLSDRGLSVRAFPPNGESKSIAVATEKAPALAEGEWTELRVVLRGEEAVVRVGEGFERSYHHASFAREKANLSLGFSFGSLSVADFVASAAGSEATAQ